MPTHAVPECQTAILQSGGDADQRLMTSDTVPTPSLTSRHHVLVRVLAVALNPTDHKMPVYFPSPGGRVGCDFCGVVVQTGDHATSWTAGTRVCGGLYPYGRKEEAAKNPDCGAFAQFVVTDGRLLVRIPDTWSDLQGAALGGIGWTTVGLAMSDANALGLGGFPSKRDTTKTKSGQPMPVLVYGAAAATGTMACQLLALSGYAPIAITSTQSAQLATAYGARHTAAYTSPTWVQDVKDAMADEHVRHAVDCITTRESAKLCFAALHRTGGRYACLERLPDEWRTRRAVHVKEVMAFEGLGRAMMVDDATYSRDANPALFEVCRRWAGEVQQLVDAGRLKSHPVREVKGGWDGVISGLEILRKGSVRGEKLAVQLSVLD